MTQNRTKKNRQVLAKKTIIIITIFTVIILILILSTDNDANQSVVLYRYLKRSKRFKKLSNRNAAHSQNQYIADHEVKIKM